MSTKAMSSAEKNRLNAASCLHESRIQSVFFHRAKAREREAAKRMRACTAAPAPGKAAASCLHESRIQIPDQPRHHDRPGEQSTPPVTSEDIRCMPVSSSASLRTNLSEKGLLEKCET